MINNLKKVICVILAVLTLPLLSVSAEWARRSDYQYLTMETGLPAIHLTIPERARISLDKYIDVQVQTRNSKTDIKNPITGKMRARGNSTFYSSPKKSFKIKLDKKANLCSMGEAKTWNLVANWSDKTEMRNYLAYKLAKALGDENTPDCVMVDLFVNGSYQGNYMLVEQVEIKENRIVPPDPDATTYLVEIDERLGGENKFRTKLQRVPFVIKQPGDTTISKDQVQYVEKYINDVEEAIFAGNRMYEKYIDVDSFIDWYIVNEFFKNIDAAFYSSCFMYFSEGGKVHMGPVWDFDLSSGNVGYAGGDEVTGYRIREASWFEQLFKDETFKVRAAVRFNEVEPLLRELINEWIPKTQEMLKISDATNSEIWPRRENIDWQGYKPKYTFDEEVKHFQNFLNEWMKWLVPNMQVTPDEIRIAIDALKNDVTDEQTLAIEALEKAYNALSDEDKTKVINYDKLAQAKAFISMQPEQIVIGLIDMLPENVSTDYYDECVNIRNKYDDLKKSKKEAVYNYDKFVKFEQSLIDMVKSEFKMIVHSLNNSLKLSNLPDYEKAEILYEMLSIWPRNDIKTTVEIYRELSAKINELNNLKSEFTIKVGSFDNYSEVDYSKASWDLFSIEYKRIKDRYLEKDNSAEDFNNAIAYMDSAKGRLKVDKFLLEKYIEKARSLKESDFDAVAFANIKTKLEEAVKVLNNSKSIQYRVNTVQKALYDAMKEAGLNDKQIGIFNMDLHELGELYDILKGIDKSIYAEETVDVLEEKLEAAKELIDNESADTALIRNAFEDLKEAYQALEYKVKEAEAVDINPIKELLDKVNTLDATIYTQTSWDYLLKQIDIASKAINTQLDKVTADIILADLKDAYSSLQIKPKDLSVVYICIAGAVLVLLVAGILIFIKIKRKKIKK